jgi:hypothetical protein
MSDDNQNETSQMPVFLEPREEVYIHGYEHPEKAVCVKQQHQCYSCYDDTKQDEDENVYFTPTENNAYGIYKSVGELGPEPPSPRLATVKLNKDVYEVKDLNTLTPKEKEMVENLLKESNDNVKLLF